MDVFFQYGFKWSVSPGDMAHPVPDAEEIRTSLRRARQKQGRVDFRFPQGRGVAERPEAPPAVSSRAR